MVHVPAKFWENTSICVWVAVTDRRTDIQMGTFQYLPSWAFGKGRDNNYFTYILLGKNFKPLLITFSRVWVATTTSNTGLIDQQYFTMEWKTWNDITRLTLPDQTDISRPDWHYPTRLTLPDHSLPDQSRMWAIVMAIIHHVTNQHGIIGGAHQPGTTYNNI